MSDDPLYVGADWTGRSWLAVAFGPRELDHARVFDSIGDCWLTYEDRAERLLVDVPVGLVESGAPERPPERLARSVLGPQADTVFAAPVREATRKRRFPAATRVNERKTGRELSRRAFDASEPIAAVDELVRELPEARDAVAEAHPEVCFRAFAGEPLEEPTETAAGYAERMRVLAEYDPDAPPTVQTVAESTAGHVVSVHDVLDAVVLGYTARPGRDELRSLPERPETDAAGLPMRFCYRSSDPLEPDPDVDSDAAETA
jgi:predicted RNase H-like nuclease